MNRILLRIIAAALCCAMIFTGCATAKNPVAGSSDQATGSAEPSKIAYEYEQALNVIDDNYRTYYEVFVYSFCDSDGDGIGDLKGLTSKLNYITEMGFNGIWLMPIMPSTTYHKYDVVDYYSIDKQYGTLDDFKTLVAECDKRGIKLIIDFVINHTSAQNEWFKSACKSVGIAPCGQAECTEKDLCREHNKYCGYYNFAEEKSTGWYYPVMGTTGWYYEGKFWDQMPDLNLENEELRRDIEAIAKFWLDMGVGGFRLDAAKEFVSGNNTKNIEILKWFNDYCKSVKPNAYLVGEVWDTPDTYASYYQSGVNSFFDFKFAQADGYIAQTINMQDDKNSAAEFGKKMAAMYMNIKNNNTEGIDASFFTNHDTARASGFMRRDPARIKMAGAMNLMMYGSSFVYYGEELGMSGSGKDENKRAPMPWSTTDKTGITYGPPAMEKQENSFAAVDEQLKDELSILNCFKRAVRLRNENPEIARGDVTAIDVGDKEICAVKRSYNGSDIYLLYNISAEQRTCTFDKAQYGYGGIRGYISTDGEPVTLADSTFTLPPYSIAVVK